jgi:hypothetical protein
MISDVPLKILVGQERLTLSEKEGLTKGSAK